jgi:hypothetical protein
VGSVGFEGPVKPILLAAFVTFTFYRFEGCINNIKSSIIKIKT